MEHRLYKKNGASALSDELFLNPTSEYRGAPFWAWNTKPDKETLKTQIDAFEQMGFGGFHIHSRTGLDIPYLGDEFMEDVRYCVEYAAQKHMLAWAYDEDRFPSGFAGGLVTKEKKYRYRELLWTPKPLEGALQERPKEKAEESYLIGIYDIVLDEDGYLKEYRRITDSDRAKGNVWYGYLRVAAPESWFNNQTYVDTLDKEAIARFCQVTHERYKEVVGEYFGTVIPSFFTDEPKTTYKKTLPFAAARQNLIMPWTDDFPDTFGEKYHMDIVEKLPELFWQLPDGQISPARYLYHRHVAERFVESYSATIGSWCDKNGVSLTGHMIKEPTLKSQSTAIGESMAPLGPFGFPGIDMLCDEREYTTAKQAQSIMHQFGREAMLSELYGVTNWDFDFRGHKAGGDWQAALGVTVRVPHLSWMTMEGEAKRDYPASIHYQSPWYQEYKLIEDHFSRVNTAMTRGRAVVHIGVIHPVESFWCFWGPEEHTAAMRAQLDDRFQDLTEWLLFAQLDFDFISESVLSKMQQVKNGRFVVGEAAYDVVLAPGCVTLRSTTIDALEAFAAAGGRVVIAGEVPEYEEGLPSGRMKALLEQYRNQAQNGQELSGSVEKIPCDRYSVVKSLESCREVKLFNADGSACNKHMCQLRADGPDRWLFIVYGLKKIRYDNEPGSKMTIRVKGTWYPLLYDTLTGRIRPCAYRHEKGQTVIVENYWTLDSFLIRLCADPEEIEKRAADAAEKAPVSNTAVLITDPGRVPFTLSEPNAAVLDLAEYRVDGGKWQPAEEVLRVGQKVREAYGFTPQGGKMAQPWTSEKPPMEHKLTLKFTIQSRVRVEAPRLAMEQPETAAVTLNGQPVEVQVTGWYVDTAIRTISLPPIEEGKNVLCITLPFGENANIENAFLLGDFGVEPAGGSYVLTAMPKTLAFGDIVPQGLPFYGGNVSYHLEVETPGGDFAIRTSYYRGALIGVSVDGKREGSIAFTPYRFEKRGLTAGRHTVTLTLFGNRVNTFGTLHNCNENGTWFGPDAWRSKGDAYSEEYQLKRMGILKRPELY